MTKNELQEILRTHSKWVSKNYSSDGKKAKLTNGVDFGKADLGKADLVGANLIGVNLRRANLKTADLRGANLKAADLRDTDLREADLRGTSLQEAKLDGADLTAADLWGANLMGAELKNTNLERASLNDASLINTTFLQSRLTGADFSNARFGGTTICNQTLSRVIGLESVRHQQSSYIDVDTLRNSRGEIPDLFLKGCGFQDWEIESAKLYQEGINQAKWNDILYEMHNLRFSKAIVYFSVFISYSHSDKVFATALHDKLQAVGIRCWLDEHQMLVGDDIYEQIDRGITLWDKLLLCCSVSSLSEKWWVDLEINKAFEKERGLMRKRSKKVLAMVPLDLDGYLFSEKYENPKKDEITSRVAADFNGWENNQKLFEESGDKVIKALRADAGRRETPPASLI